MINAHDKSLAYPTRRVIEFVELQYLRDRLDDVVRDLEKRKILW
jgi:hypothetical protein